MNDLRLKLKFDSICNYILSRSLEDMEREVSNTYVNDMLYSLVQIQTKKATGKINDKLKDWSTIKGLIDGTIEIDNRTAKQIEEDTLNLFKRD